MNSFLFWFKFHRALLLRVQLTATQHGLDNDLPPNRRQAIIWNNADPIRWGIYAALGGDELNTCKILDSSRSSTRALYIQIHLWTYMHELKPKVYHISSPLLLVLVVVILLILIQERIWRRYGTIQHVGMVCLIWYHIYIYHMSSQSVDVELL